MKIFSYKTLKLAITILIAMTAVLLVALMAGCGPDRSGTAADNEPPVIQIVNTPPDGTTFLRNPDIYWYATDIDGYVAYYRYLVVREDQMYIVGTTYADTLIKVSVEEFVDSLESGYQWPENMEVPGWQGVGIDTDTMDIPPDWMELAVDLDNPQTSGTINLFADPDYPVDSSVTQYLFVQAEDDMGAFSTIAYRRYSRINNYPTTSHDADQTYINSKGPEDPAPGISLTWSGGDQEDWGRATPPLQYEWRLYGPFLPNDPIYINLVQEGCVYDPEGDSMIGCRDVMVIDIEALPKPVGNVSQPLFQSEGEDGTVWVDDTTHSFYNVFDRLSAITETTQYKFVFWVRSRDDGYLPDPTPAFSVFYCIEALFERPVMVLDDNEYIINSGRWMPWEITYPDPQPPDSILKVSINNRGNIDLVKRLMKEYIDKALENIYGAGYIPLDTTHPQFSGDPQNYRTDYFNNSQYRAIDNIDYLRTQPTMVDLLSHKVYLCLNEDLGIGTRYEPSQAELPWSFYGLAMGGTGWYMHRNAGNLGFQQDMQSVNMDATFAYYYGIESVEFEGFLHNTLHPIVNGICSNKSVYNEQFVGAYSRYTDLVPHVDADLDILSNRYWPVYEESWFAYNHPLFGSCPDFYADSLHQFTGMPEVGTCQRTANATAIYLYESKYGDISPYHGRVVGVANVEDAFRTMAYLFTPLSLDSLQCYDLFNQSLDYLLEKFDETKSNTPVMGYDGSASDEILKARVKANEMLQGLLKEAEEDPALMEALGLKLDPPILIEK